MRPTYRRRGERRCQAQSRKDATRELWLCSLEPVWNEICFSWFTPFFKRRVAYRGRGEWRDREASWHHQVRFLWVQVSGIFNRVDHIEQVDSGSIDGSRSTASGVLVRTVRFVHSMEDQLSRFTSIFFFIMNRFHSCSIFRSPSSSNHTYFCIMFSCLATKILHRSKTEKSQHQWWMKS